MEAFEDPKNPGNHAAYRTGEPCMEMGCDKPAGTAWSPFYCFEHNVRRIKRVTRQFNVLLEEHRSECAREKQDG